MTIRFLAPLIMAGGVALAASSARADDGLAARLAKIRTFVVIYAENRSFDNLYAGFPGADGINVWDAQKGISQHDRDGHALLPYLPDTWDGVTGPGVVPPVPADATRGFRNGPFWINAQPGLNLAPSVQTRDLWHRFYQNQMQINRRKDSGGAWRGNDMFVAWSDAGGLTMGMYKVDPSSLPLWKVASEYVLADRFFQSAFGGSFLNHIYLICSCAPVYPGVANSPAAKKVAAVAEDGVSLVVDMAKSPASALNGPPVFVNDGAITPDGFAVNTMMPPFQPSAVPPPKDDVSGMRADPANPSTLPPQTAQTIGDLLSGAGIDWAWYGGAWGDALARVTNTPPPAASPNFQYHHQPFNYFAAFDPTTTEGAANRAAHLRDGGRDGAAFLADVDAGKLPTVTFYKPQGDLNEHAGYTDVGRGDAHIADVIRRLQAGPQWPGMMVVVTYDEFGGWWDHVVPPTGDRFGPGTRIPAIIAGPMVKRGVVDHTQYDTTSVIRFITRRWNLPVLPGVKMRDEAMTTAGSGTIGDLTGALAE